MTNRFRWAHRLLHDEGWCVGGSSGVNVAGAIRLARELGPGHTVVTILCDAGTRYQAKLFNPQLSARKKYSGAGVAGCRVSWRMKPKLWPTRISA